MKSIVLYSSKTGFAGKYAKWIAEELSVRAVPSREVSIDELIEHDNIIFGGGLYAVGINGIDLIKKNMDRLAGKNLFVFATGASPPREETIKEIRDRNFTPAEQERIDFFYLRGGFDFERLNLKDKILMKMLKKKLRMKKELSPDEKGMLDAYENPVDFTEKENIIPLIEAVRGKQ